MIGNTEHLERGDMTTLPKNKSACNSNSELRENIHLILDSDLDELIPAIPDLTSFEQSIELLGPIQIKINRLMRNVEELIGYAAVIRQQARFLTYRPDGSERVQ
jgi:hypothetical protein